MIQCIESHEREKKSKMVIKYQFLFLFIYFKFFSWITVFFLDGVTNAKHSRIQSYRQLFCHTLVCDSRSNSRCAMKKWIFAVFFKFCNADSTVEQAFQKKAHYCCDSWASADISFVDRVPVSFQHVQFLIARPARRCTKLSQYFKDWEVYFPSWFELASPFPSRERI